MNAIQKKILGDYVSQVGMYLLLACLMGLTYGWVAGLKVMGIAVLVHMLCAPVSYWYLQRRAKREALEDAERIRKFAEDAPFRAQMRAYMNALVAANDATAAQERKASGTTP